MRMILAFRSFCYFLEMNRIKRYVRFQLFLLYILVKKMLIFCEAVGYIEDFRSIEIYFEVDWSK